MKLIHLIFYFLILLSLGVAALEVVYNPYQDLDYSTHSVYTFYPVDECTCNCSNVYEGY